MRTGGRASISRAGRSGWRENDPGVLADAAVGSGLFRRRHRCDDRAGRSRSRLQSELRARLARQRPSQAVGRATDLAIEHAGRALRLSPRAEAGQTSYLIGIALFFSRRFEEAVPRLRVAIEDMPAFPTAYRYLAACYAHMGLLDEARATIARLRAITPEVMVNYPLPFRDPAHRELFLSGLRLAAGETT